MDCFPDAQGRNVYPVDTGVDYCMRVWNGGGSEAGDFRLCIVGDKVEPVVIRYFDLMGGIGSIVAIGNDTNRWDVLLECNNNGLMDPQIWVPVPFMLIIWMERTS